jgi:VCBS repeat-containing protein
MTNHNPVITSANATGSFSETSNTTGSTTLHALSGTMNFTDADTHDTHTTGVTLKSAVLSSGSIIPATTLADLNSAMTSVIQTDSNGSGKLRWSFGAEDDDFDFLSKNQTLTLTYQIKLSDNHGGSTTKTVTVTITGTDDKPVIDFGATAIVTEQADHTLSLTPDTAHIAVHFTDPDLTNTGHTASVVGASASGATGGLLPGSLGDAELMSFFHIDSVVKASGSSNGTVNTTFSAPDLAFDYLAQGETLDIAYTIRVDDHAGGTNTQVVTVTVIGSNDAPIYLSPSDTEHLTEGQHLDPAGNLTARGDLFFTDIDLSDTHSAATSVTATRTGGGTIPLTDAQLLAALSTSVEDSTGHLLGEIDWNFALDNDAIGFLSAGEILTLTYHIAVVDSAGGADTQTVTIKILGTNHPVVITSGPEAAAIAEFADTTGSTTPNATSPVPTDSIAFSDPDTGDTHTVNVTVGALTWSAGGGVPAATQADLAGALSTTLHDSTGTGTGSVDWSFSVPDNDLDFLAAGETLTVGYNVEVRDGSTGATQTVTITIDGANDLPVITSGPGAASLAELADTNNSPTLDTTPTDSLAFDDPDLSDTHSVSATLTSAVWSFDPSFVPAQTLSDLFTALSTTLHDSAGSGHGSIDWTFSITDRDLDFLGAGETLTVTYDVSIADALASSTQSVTITIFGSQDPLVVNPVAADAFDTAFIDQGNVIAAGSVDLFNTGGDASAHPTITAVNGSAANVGFAVAGTYGTLFLDADGSYSYTANAAVDPLQVGDSATDQFQFTATDSLNRSVTTTLTVTVHGADDAPMITSADVVGSMTEDAGPTVLINGGFETGDLSGWFAGSAVDVTFVGIGGAFGNYAAHLGPTGGDSISQLVATTPGQHYTLDFVVSGDPESTGNSLTVFWDGATILATTDQFGGFTHYTFDVVGAAAQANTALVFSYADDGTGLFLDQVAVQPTPGPATETASGNISFSDIETGDTHIASAVALGGDYVGTFSLDPVSESGGTGSVAWHFTVDNADIQFLSQGQTLTQTYTVFITDDNGAVAQQDVSVAINGSNDAPTAVGETVITDAGAGGTVEIPTWALAANDTDPDALDHLTPNALVGSSGGAAAFLGDAFFFFDDATPGGSLDYTVTDGHVTSSNAATATIVNNAVGTGALVGTAGADILIATGGSESLDGGGGNDVLIGNSGSHALTGGAGDDLFAFRSAADGPDTITDFSNVTGHDRILIEAAGFSGLTSGQDPATVFESSGDDQFLGALLHYDTANQTLYYSADGTTASAVALAQLQAGVLLHANDLVIV